MFINNSPFTDTHTYVRLYKILNKLVHIIKAVFNLLFILFESSFSNYLWISFHIDKYSIISSFIMTAKFTVVWIGNDLFSQSLIDGHSIASNFVIRNNAEINNVIKMILHIFLILSLE